MGAKSALLQLAAFVDDVTGRRLGYRNPITNQDSTPASLRVTTAITTLAVTENLHEDGEILLSLLAGFVCTLPASTGGGAKYRFRVGIVNTTNQYKIQVANASDIMQGSILTVSDNSAAVLGYNTASDSDTITLNGTTTGGLTIGDWVEVIDAKLNKWLVRGVTSSSGTEATPFSAAV